MHQKLVRPGEERFEHTLQEPVMIKGRGLVWGKEITVQIQPANPGQGIVFVRTDLDCATIQASLKNVTNTFRWITLKAGRAKVSIVEHVLAALYIAGVDNARVTINSQYLPSLPESILPYLYQIGRAGLICQKEPRRFWVVKKEGRFNLKEAGERSVATKPSSDLAIDYYISFPKPIGDQHFVATDQFWPWFHSIAAARAFGIYDRLPRFLLERVTQSFVIVKRGEFLNRGPHAVRWGGKEPIRHKIIDFVGALALLGGRIRGRFMVSRSGHTIDIRALGSFLDQGILTEVHEA